MHYLMSEIIHRLNEMLIVTGKFKVNSVLHPFEPTDNIEP